MRFFCNLWQPLTLFGNSKMMRHSRICQLIQLRLQLSSLKDRGHTSQLCSRRSSLPSKSKCPPQLQGRSSLLMLMSLYWIHLDGSCLHRLSWLLRPGLVRNDKQLRPRLSGKHKLWNLQSPVQQNSISQIHGCRHGSAIRRFDQEYIATDVLLLPLTARLSAFDHWSDQSIMWLGKSTS